ncbi:36329_t:CDS:2, partial [Racocetra persica]
MSPLKRCLGSDRKKEVKRLSNNSGAEENIEFQEWLNKTCLSVEDKEKVKEIIIDENNPLEEIDGGKLDLREYPNLETLIIDGEELKSKLISLNVSKCLNLKRVYCYGNQLTKLDLTNLPKLEELICSDNRLTSLDLTNLNRLKLLLCRDNQLTKINYPLNPKKLTELSIRNNNLVEHDLSIFSRFINLEKLFIGNDYKENIEKGEYNRFFGSLKPLQNLTKLKLLHINNTYVDTDLENLPENIREIYCQTCLDDNQLAKLQLESETKIHALPHNYDENEKKMTSVIKKLSNQKYPKEKRNKVREIYLNEPGLEGELDLSDFTYDGYGDIKVYISTCVDEAKLIIKTQLEKVKIMKLVQAQKYICKQYPTTEARENTTKLGISSENLEGELDLSDFVNLRSLNCSYNKLTSLNINNCSQLESIWCTGNQLINLEISSCPNLTLIDCSENQLVGLDFSQNNSLSEIHCHGNLLEEITLPSIKDKLIILILNVKEKINQGIYNRWYGSLMFLKNIAKLKELEIIDTDIDSGLEHLPANLEKIYCKWRDDGNLFSKFAEEATQKWIELGFTKDACEEWLKVGMKVDDSDYCAWLRDVKKIDAKEMMDYDNNEQLEKEFKEHLKTLETKEKELENLKSELQLLGGKMVNWSKKRKIKESIDNLTNEINITKGLKLSGK